MFEKYNKVQRAVLATTLKLITQKELQATSMSLISKESGISIGSIYNYFVSKEDIINELYKGIIKFYGETVLKDFSKKGAIQKRFQQIWENIIKFSIKYPKAFLFTEQYSFSPYISDEAKQEAADKSWAGPLEKLYSEAISQEQFIELDPHLMIQMHFGAVVYLVKAHFRNNIELTDEMIQTAIGYCWNAVAKKNAVYEK